MLMREQIEERISWLEGYALANQMGGYPTKPRDAFELEACKLALAYLEAVGRVPDAVALADRIQSGGYASTEHSRPAFCHTLNVNQAAELIQSFATQLLLTRGQTDGEVVWRGNILFDRGIPTGWSRYEGQPSPMDVLNGYLFCTISKPSAPSQGTSEGGDGGEVGA